MGMFQKMGFKMKAPSKKPDPAEIRMKQVAPVENQMSKFEGIKRMLAKDKNKFKKSKL